MSPNHSKVRNKIEVLFQNYLRTKVRKLFKKGNTSMARPDYFSTLKFSAQKNSMETAPKKHTIPRVIKMWRHNIDGANPSLGCLVWNPRQRSVTTYLNEWKVEFNWILT